MGLFKDIAEPLVGRGVPVIPLRPRTKIAFLTNWQDAATTDPEKIEQWDQEYADANAACVAFARQDGIWFFEIDREGFAKKIEQETGNKLPDTFMVRSSPGRGHFYFKQTPESIAMGNKQAKDEQGELWSARVDNRYVVAPGSYHPTSGKRYETLRDVPIVPAPDWLIKWCSSSVPVAAKTGDAELDDESPISEGGRNNALTSILGKARQVLAMDREQLYEYGLSVNQKRCRPQLSDSEVRTIANSIASYEVTTAAPVIFGGKTPPPDPIIPVSPDCAPYPVFPRWVIKGTSVGDGFVYPWCEKNSRYPEFMFMPAMTVMLNYLALKVSVEYKGLIPSIYMVSIGRKGRVIKSSCVEDSIEYFQSMNMVDHGMSSRSAAGKSLLWTAGSPEGLGLEMSRTSCKNALLFYDELTTLTDKASIENSGLGSRLLTMYESGSFANTVKNKREMFSLPARSYCTSLIACTTEKNFPLQWGKMSAGSSGLDERFFFLYQPELLIPLTPKHQVNTVLGAIETKKLIERAILQGKYSIIDETMLEGNINRLGNRTCTRVEKMALYFAIDMGKNEIDEPCIERAMAIADYELAVKKYLKVFETKTPEGALQSEMIQYLQRHKGVSNVRDMERALHPLKHGLYYWNRAFGGLVNSGWMIETGTGTKGSPRQLILTRAIEEDE